MSPARPRASLIYNPKAGRRRHGDTLEQIRAVLGQTYEIEVSPTAGPRDAIRLAREAAARSDAAIFGWGGDGTIREVVEGMLGSPSALGVLPGGTFNVVALAVGLPRRDPVAAARMLADAKPQPRDAGLIGSTPFLMQTSLGFDGYVMKELRPDMKARFGMAGTVSDGVRALMNYDFPWFEVTIDGKAHEVTGAIFVNMAEYAGRYEVVPGARWDDQLAHALLYTGRSRFAAVRFALGIATRRHHLDRNVRIVPAVTMTVPANAEVFVQTDGDVWDGPRPAVCRLSEHRVNVLIPNAAA